MVTKSDNVNFVVNGNANPNNNANVDTTFICKKSRCLKRIKRL